MLDGTEFLRGYIDAQLWANTLQYDENGELGSADAFDATLSPETLASAESDCRNFLDSVADWGILPTDENDLIVWPQGYDPDQAGHDYALTRNGHGAGFWDRGLGEVGDKLADLAKSDGECDWFLEDGIVTNS